MRYIYILFLFAINLYAQKDFSEQWSDLYSYNDVKDFTIVENKLYAACDNAMFTYDLNTEEITKLSSINGLSGEKTSSIFFDKDSNKILLGYENGLVEIISENGQVIPITGVRENLILVEKSVTGFFNKDGKSFVFGAFGILELDINKYEIGDSYKLSNNNSSTKVYDLELGKETQTIEGIETTTEFLYAATENGLYKVDVNLDLSVFSNWELLIDGVVSNLSNKGDEVLFSKGRVIYTIYSPTSAFINETSNILHLSKTDTEFVVTTKNHISVYDIVDFNLLKRVNRSDIKSHNYIPSKAFMSNNELYLNTTNFGILTRDLNAGIDPETNLPREGVYTEIHPDGPSRNDAFTITVKDNKQWIVYGGYDLNGYSNFRKALGVDIFDGVVWNNLVNEKLGGRSVVDYTRAIVDPFDSSRLLVATYNKGILEYKNNEFVSVWDHTTTLDVLSGHGESGSVDWIADLIVDNNNMVWALNARAKENKLFTMYDGSKEGAERWVLNVGFPSESENRDIGVAGNNTSGVNKMFVDHNNNIYAGTRNYGVFVFNANPISNGGTRQISAINSKARNGSLISGEVLSVAVDENEKIWIGTDLGLMVYDDYENLFNDGNKRNAEQVIIEENGDARAFLGSTAVRDIVIDEANNKWFATQGAGLFQTCSDAQKTFNIFTTSNSPLPSNTIIDLELDRGTGLMYIVTDRGTVVYNPKTEPFGTGITSIVAYPNPVVRTSIGHDVVTFVAKDGNGIPDGTNLKIVDVSGRLVFETNILDNGQSEGGKFVWDKKNLRGNLVASGIYVVLFSNAEGTENTTTKIAIVN